MSSNSEHKEIQKEYVIGHILEFGFITPVTAMEEYGVMRLAARISDLRKDGWPIISEPVVRKNRFGKTVRFASYRLAA